MYRVLGITPELAPWQKAELAPWQKISPVRPTSGIVTTQNNLDMGNPVSIFDAASQELLRKGADVPFSVLKIIPAPKCASGVG